MSVPSLVSEFVIILARTQLVLIDVIVDTDIKSFTKENAKVLNID